jgi:hypothetical protein
LESQSLALCGARVFVGTLATILVLEVLDNEDTIKIKWQAAVNQLQKEVF